MRDLPALLNQLEQVEGQADPVPSADGWELVLAENVAQAAASAQLPANVPGIARHLAGAAPSRGT